MTNENNKQAMATTNSARAVATAPTEKLRGLISTPAIKARFEEMLGKRSASFLSSVLSAVSANKALGDCEPMSVISAAAVAAALDLPVNQSLGFAHIVPYGSNAQFQLGWKGFVQLAMRSGQYKTINLAVVKEGQIKFHNPFTGDMEFDPEARSNKTAGYLLYFKLLNGYEKYFYMTAEECHEHGKRYSRSYAKNFGVWVDDFDAMALKTVAKLGLSKYGILSVDMQTAFVSDQAEINEDGAPRYLDARVVSARQYGEPEQNSGTRALNKRIAAKKTVASNEAVPNSLTVTPEAAASGVNDAGSAEEHF